MPLLLQVVILCNLVISECHFSKKNANKLFYRQIKVTPIKGKFSNLRRRCLSCVMGTGECNAEVTP